MAGCVDNGNGKLCPSGGTSNPCDPFQLSKTADNCLYDSVVAESLNIGGAPLNIYKLLGITSRNSNQDVTGRGAAVSSSNIPGFPAANAFGRPGSFRSSARGVDVMATAFIGWEFGELTMADGSRRFVNPGAMNQSITAVTLTQSKCEEWTASRLRVERSMDGIRWVGVAILDEAVPGLKTYTFADTAPARYWRIRPVDFRGAATNEFWEVEELWFHESGIPDINNIEDKVLFENRNREYATTPVPLKGTFAHADSMLDLVAHGMQLTQSLMIEVSFSAAVAALGRPPVVGDIIEMPSEVMYDQNLRAVKKFVEVMDVAWSSTSYTPGWQPTLLRLKVDPALSSRETKQIFGGSYHTPANGVNPAQFWEEEPVPGAVTQDYTSITETIRAEAKNEVPMRGIDQSGTGQPTPAEIEAVAAKIGEENVAPFIKPQKGFYVEDALPPNGEPYTEGTELPASAADGAYHRMIYTGSAKDIPARLYRFSGVKGRWIYLETDKRSQYDPLSPQLLNRT